MTYDLENKKASRPSNLKICDEYPHTAPWHYYRTKLIYKNLKSNISKFHNSVQNYRTEIGLQNVHIGLVFFISVKFHELLTDDIREKVFTNWYTNLKVSISKFHNSTKNYRTGTGLQYAQLGLVVIISVKFHEILNKSFHEIVFTNSYKNVKVNIKKLHNSAQNYRTRTDLQHDAQLGLVSIIVVKFHEILTNGF